MASTTTPFKHTELYGGAITVDLPSAFGDASTIRQIPDHQEVYLNNDGYSSIIFEILERVEKSSDEDALQYHFFDLVNGTGDSTNILGQGRTTLAKLPNNSALVLSFIQTPVPDPRRKTPEFVAIHLILLRLKDQKTDLLISVNNPHYAGEYVKAAAEGEDTQLMKDGEATTKRIIESFEIKDWNLFNGS